MVGFPRAVIVGGATCAVAATALVLATDHRASAQPPALSSTRPAAGEGTIVKVGLFDWLFGGSPRERGPQPGPRFERAPPPSGEDRRDDDEHEERRERYQGTFKTLCVRLCDGFYYPISTAAPREMFASDAKRCEQSCPTRSRLFVHRNPGGGVENMVDLAGHPYRDLPTAFQHLTRYDANCTCHGNPWDEEALARHRAYAQEAERKAADHVAQTPPAVEPPRRAGRQSSWGYRDRRARRDWSDSD
jgi:Protein of unknown function (DUF2865)